MLTRRVRDPRGLNNNFDIFARRRALKTKSDKDRHRARAFVGFVIVCTKFSMLTANVHTVCLFDTGVGSATVKTSTGM